MERARSVIFALHFKVLHGIRHARKMFGERKDSRMKDKVLRVQRPSASRNSLASTHVSMHVMVWRHCCGCQLIHEHPESSGRASKMPSRSLLGTPLLYESISTFKKTRIQVSRSFGDPRSKIQEEKTIQIGTIRSR